MLIIRNVSARLYGGRSHIMMVSMLRSLCLQSFND
jgi:hypothetical protein